MANINFGDFHIKEEEHYFFVDEVLLQANKLNTLMGITIDSKELDEKIDKMILEKINSSGDKWSGKFTKECCIDVVITKEKKLETNLLVCIESLEDDRKFDCFELPIDLSEYETEIKEIVKQNFIDRFF